MSEELERVLTAPFEPWRHGEGVLDRRHQFVIERVMAHQPKSVLEVGPGTGKLGWHLFFREGVGVAFLDNDLDNLRAIQAFAVSQGVRTIEYFQEDIGASRQPLAQGIGDVVVACEVIEHVPDWRQAIGNMMTLARKAVVFTTPVGYSFDDPGHVHHFKAQDFLWLAAFEDWAFNLWTMPTKLADIKTEQACFVVELIRT